MTFTTTNDVMTKFGKLLNPADKILLDNDNIIIFRLDNNRKINNELKKMNCEPIAGKKLHDPMNYTTVRRVYDNINEYIGTKRMALPFYCTIAFIPSTNTKKFNVACCSLDMTTLGNNIFADIDSSGIMFNGSYFYLQQHVVSEMYGSTHSKLIKNTNKNADPDEFNISENFPIGLIKFNKNSHGEVMQNQFIYDGFSLENETHKIVDPPNDSYVYTLPNLTLWHIRDTLGFVMFPESGNPTIIPFDSPQKNITLANNVDLIMGNLLVKDGKNIILPELYSVALIKFPIPSLNLKQYDKIYLCNDDLELMSDNDIKIISENVGENLEISFKVSNDGVKKADGKIVFNHNNVYLPYSTVLLKQIYGNKLAGQIPPGFPNHASDLNPRTCMIIDNNNNTMILQIDGREVCGGVGIDLFDLAKLCVGLGAVYALNLDGGSSSKLMWKEKSNIIDYVGKHKYTISNSVYLA